MTGKSSDASWGEMQRLSCHCGAVEIEIFLPHGLVDPRRCNCSICGKRGAIAASVPLANLAVVAGAEHLGLCRFNTRTAKHYFCKICGTYTHHQRRSNPDQYAFNVACLEGVNLHELGEVEVLDGINHPSDRANASHAAKDELDTL